MKKYIDYILSSLSRFIWFIIREYYVEKPQGIYIYILYRLNKVETIILL